MLLKWKYYDKLSYRICKLKSKMANTINDIFRFVMSLCSSTMQAELIAASIPIDEMNCYNNFDAAGMRGFYIHVIDSTSPPFKIEVMKTEAVGKVGVCVATGEDFGNLMLVVIYQDSLESVRDWTIHHVFSTFRRITNFNYEFDSERELEDDPILNFRTHFHNLTVKGPRHPYSRPLSAKDMKLIFERLAVSNNLTIFSMIENDYQFNYRLQFRKVFVKYADWISMDAVINSTCVELGIIYAYEPPVAQLRAFLDAWINREAMENLELFTLDLAHGEMTAQYFRELLQGIPYRLVSSVHVSIQRIDGRQAICRLRSTDNGTQFNLRVFN